MARRAIELYDVECRRGRKVLALGGESWGLTAGYPEANHRRSLSRKGPGSGKPERIEPAS